MFAAVLRFYGLHGNKVAAVVASIRADKKRWVDFKMRFELGLEEPDPKRARNSALSHIAGCMVPLALFFFRPVHSALVASVVVALLVFGYVKGRFTTAKPFRSAWQTVVGGLAATAAFVIAKAIGPLPDCGQTGAQAYSIPPQIYRTMALAQKMQVNVAEPFSPGKAETLRMGRTT